MRDGVQRAVVVKRDPGSALRLIQPEVAPNHDAGSLEVFFSVFGVVIRVLSNEPQALIRLQHWLPTHWPTVTPRDPAHTYSLVAKRSSAGSTVLYVVQMDHVHLGRSRDIDQACLLLTDALHFGVAVRSRAHLFVHAGVVGIRGVAIVLPGSSGAGKTTLVEALVRAGADYYSDEFAAFDVHGHVHPYARPLCVRSQDGQRSQRRVEHLGGRIGERALPVGWIVSMRYRSGGQLRLRRIPAGAGFVALFRNTIVARVDPQFALPILSRVATQAIALGGTRAEATSSAHALLSALMDVPSSANHSLRNSSLNFELSDDEWST